MSDNDFSSRTALAGAPMLIRHDGGAWEAPSTSRWSNEADLRDLVVNNPSLIPGIDPASAAVREFNISVTARVDVVIVDPQGNITLVEAKLSSNPEIRRKVIGQALAYAAALSEMAPDDFFSQWTARAGSSLGVSVLGAEADATEVDELYDRVRSNIESGGLRLVVAVDRLTNELRSTIAYLAAHTTPDVEVLALEVAYARHGTTEILVPRTYGSELKPSQPVARDSFSVPLEVARGHVRDAMVGQLAGAAEAVDTVFDILGDRISYLYFGNKALLDPVVIITEPVRCQPFKLQTQGSHTGLRICFQWMVFLGQERVEALFAEIATDERIAAHLGGVAEAGFRRRPLIPFSTLVQPGVAEHIAGCVARALDSAAGK